MKFNAILAAALLAVPLAGGPPAFADELVTHVAMQTSAAAACWAGYHPDQDGNCQPNIPETPRYCDAPGLMYQPAPWGWTCVPIPKGY